jgi:hypothetical protein
LEKVPHIYDLRLLVEQKHREATEIRLHPDTINKKEGLRLSKTSDLANRLFGLSNRNIALHMKGWEFGGTYGKVVPVFN